MVLPKYMGSFLNEQHEENARNIKKIDSFEDIYKTYMPPERETKFKIRAQSSTETITECPQNNYEDGYKQNYGEKDKHERFRIASGDMHSDKDLSVCSGNNSIYEFNGPSSNNTKLSCVTFEDENSNNQETSTTGLYGGGGGGNCYVTRSSESDFCCCSCSSAAGSVGSACTNATAFGNFNYISGNGACDTTSNPCLSSGTQSFVDDSCCCRAGNCDQNHTQASGFGNSCVNNCNAAILQQLLHQQMMPFGNARPNAGFGTNCDCSLNNNSSSGISSLQSSCNMPASPLLCGINMLGNGIGMNADSGCGMPISSMCCMPSSGNSNSCCMPISSNNGSCIPSGVHNGCCMPCGGNSGCCMPPGPFCQCQEPTGNCLDLEAIVSKYQSSQINNNVNVNNLDCGFSVSGGNNGGGTDKFHDMLQGQTVYTTDYKPPSPDAGNIFKMGGQFPSLGGQSYGEQFGECGTCMESAIGGRLSQLPEYGISSGFCGLSGGGFDTGCSPIYMGGGNSTGGCVCSMPLSGGTTSLPSFSLNPLSVPTITGLSPYTGNDFGGVDMIDENYSNVNKFCGACYNSGYERGSTNVCQGKTRNGASYNEVGCFDQERLLNADRSTVGTKITNAHNAGVCFQRAEQPQCGNYSCYVRRNGLQEIKYPQALTARESVGNIQRDYCNQHKAIKQRNRSSSVPPSGCHNFGYKEIKFSDMVPPAFLNAELLNWNKSKHKNRDDSKARKLEPTICYACPKCIERICSSLQINTSPSCCTELQRCLFVLPMNKLLDQNEDTLGSSKRRSPGPSTPSSRGVTPSASKRQTPVSTQNSSKRESPVSSKRDMTVTSRGITPTATRSKISRNDSGKDDEQSAPYFQQKKAFDVDREPGPLSSQQKRKVSDTKPSESTSSQQKKKISDADKLGSTLSQQRRKIIDEKSEEKNIVDDANEKLTDKVMNAYDEYSATMKANCCPTYCPMQCWSKQQKPLKSKELEQDTKKVVCSFNYPHCGETNCCIFNEEDDPQDVKSGSKYEGGASRCSCVNSVFGLCNCDQLIQKDDKNNRLNAKRKGEENKPLTEKRSCGCGMDACILCNDDVATQTQNDAHMSFGQPSCSYCCPWWMYSYYPQCSFQPCCCCNYAWNPPYYCCTQQPLKELSGQSQAKPSNKVETNPTQTSQPQRFKTGSNGLQSRDGKEDPLINQALSGQSTPQESKNQLRDTPYQISTQQTSPEHSQLPTRPSSLTRTQPLTQASSQPSPQSLNKLSAPPSSRSTTQSLSKQHSEQMGEEESDLDEDERIVAGQIFPHYRCKTNTINKSQDTMTSWMQWPPYFNQPSNPCYLSFYP